MSLIETALLGFAAGAPTIILFAGFDAWAGGEDCVGEKR